MRVIAGTARRLQLKTLEGLDTRPTTDRIKETLFNMIWQDVVQTRFLDCFAGSGAIGIEALSRGAAEAVFIEKNPKAAACIRENLETTHLKERGRILTCDILSGLRRLEGQKDAFGVIFMDPPYDHQWERMVLEYLRDSRLADEDTLLIAEASLDTDFSYAEPLGYRIDREKVYKTNKHIFLKKQTGQER